MNIYAAIQFAPKAERPSLECGAHNTIALDFDDTLIHSSGPYMSGHFGAPITEGLKLLSLLQSKGYNVVILTARKETDLVANWLRAHGFPNMLVSNHKCAAKNYVDDRAITWHPNSTAEQVYQEILNSK